MQATVGIIGGSGLYQMAGVRNLKEVHIDTPYGAPSDAVMIGELDGVQVAFLPRHGRGHLHAPHEINYRANIWALKSLGVRWICSVSAVGSLREEIVPGQMVLVDQFIDRTRLRPSTFFEDGIVAHVQMADPVCLVLRNALEEACKTSEVIYHPGGTYVCIEGPQFSTRAESELYRSWGASVVGMTNLPEARLAREAEIAYATLAMATDYDCWHEGHEDVTVAAVVAVMKANVANAQTVLRHLIPSLAEKTGSTSWTALDHAIMTDPAGISEAAKARLAPLLERSLSTPSQN